MALPLTKNGLNGNGGDAVTVSPVSLDDSYAWEYDFGSHVRHLDDDEMIEKYQVEMQRHPSSLIALDAHECGHWTMQVYSTDLEKAVFQAKKLTDLWAEMLKLLSKLR